MREQRKNIHCDLLEMIIIKISLIKMRCIIQKEVLGFLFLELIFLMTSSGL